MLLQLRPALNIQRADHKGHSWMSPHHTQPCLGQRKGDTGVILQSGILQYICSLLTEGSSQASPRIPQRRHKHFPPKKSIFVRYCRWILYKFALSPKYHPFWFAPQHRAFAFIVRLRKATDTHPPTGEAISVSAALLCICLREYISIAPLFMESKWNEITFICKLFPSMACRSRGWNCISLSLTPSLTFSLPFFSLFSPTIQPLLFG